MLDAADLSPWEGRVFAPEAAEDAVLVEAGREWHASRQGTALHLSLNGMRFLSVEDTRRIAVQYGLGRPTKIEVVPIPRTGTRNVTLSLYGLAEPELRACEVDGAPAGPAFMQDCLLLTLPAERRSVVELWHSGRIGASTCTPEPIAT